MKLLLGQEEGLRHGLETQVKELQIKLKHGQSPEPAKEILAKVGGGGASLGPCSIPRSAHPLLEVRKAGRFSPVLFSVLSDTLKGGVRLETR